EFTTIFIVGVYISPSTNAKEALCELYGAISELQNAHPDGLFIIAGDFNFKSVLPKFHQNVDFATRGVNALDLVYTNIPSTYHAEPHPHLGYSDHISVMLIPSYRPLVKCSKPVLKQVKTWPAGATSALQDCFECTDWDMFRDTATNGETTNLEEYTSSVTSYIGKCIDDMTVSKSITTRPNQKPVCIVCAASVEDCCVAVGNVVGHENIVSASRMNSAIVVFLNDVEKVRKLTQNGIVGNNETILVSPLSSPAKKVMLSNVPPFISDEAISKELSRYGRMVSPIKKIPLGCKSPLVKHLVSFRRMVFMVFKEGVGELNVVFKFTVDDFDYNIFVSSDTDIKCFKCGQTGHLARACPERQSDPGVSERPGRDTAKPAGVVPPAAEPRSARPDWKKPWSTEKSSVGSGAALEPRMGTLHVQGYGGDVDMVDEPIFKYILNVTRDIVRSLKALEIEIVELQRLEATGDRGHIEALKSKKAKMKDLLDITAQGVLVHSRFKSAAEMEAPSKFFFSLEQKNGQKRFIHAVRTESGDLLSEPTEILT
ncbi:hypothetical protein QTP70_020809, partial [Hemibagrus guttatus]